MFYQVHKDDAEIYDKCSRERREIEDQVKCLLWDSFELYGPPTLEEYRDPTGKFELDYLEDYEKIYNIEKSLRVITVSMPTPIDLHNYYTYYRGRRWGEAKGCKTISMQTKGLNNMRKILDNKK